uniref:Uncharacterized protein n=1 Tax=Tanacetum cinerariifolium TaxID=118510 RepID=A0A6L2L2S4_TANCI|nr:hypothetical protein [Tanacetum cinerariifolium]
MILEPGDQDHEVPVAETFHEQTDDELIEKEVKQMEADDQAIQIILIDLPEDIYAAVDSCETAHEILLCVQQMMKGSDIRIQDKKAKNLVVQNAVQNLSVQNQASTSGAQINKALVYDLDGSAEEASKFVRDFKSLAKEADESFANHMALEFEIERLLRAVVSQDIMSIVQNNTAKTKTPQPRSNTKNDRVPSTSKSSFIKNKEVEVEEHHRNLLLSKNKKHMSFECNNVKLAILNDKSKVICAMCKQRLITSNYDVCVLNYVNDMNSCMNNLCANVSKITNQKKHKSKVTKPKKVGSKERLASPKPKKPRTYLRWSPTRTMFDLKGKIIESNESESQSDCSKGDNACTSNP